MNMRIACELPLHLISLLSSLFQIIDEKSLIKKYQKEISSLKQELQQLKRGMMENPYMMAGSTQEDLVNLKLQVCAANLDITIVIDFLLLK